MSSDYILQIRGLIKKVEELNVLFDDKFFDSICFWQKAYQESQAEQTKLLDTIYELEQRNQSLLAKAREGSTSDNKSPSATKRKADGLQGNGDSAEAAKKRRRGRSSNVHSKANSKSKRNEPDQNTVELEC